MLQVTVGKGSRDMDEGFELRHLTGHEQELLGGGNVKLHGMSGENEAKGNAASLYHAPWFQSQGQACLESRLSLNML